jgi:hypothetical protein
MDQALAALQLGYLSRELRVRLASVWSEHPFKPHPDPGPCLKAIDGCLNSLSDCMSDGQRARATKLLDQIATRHDGVCEFIVDIAFTALQEAERQPKKNRPVLQEKVAEDDGKAVWQQWQQQDWTALWNLLQAIVGTDRRFAAWFETGDHMADIRGKLARQYLTVPFKQQDWDYLYSGIDQLDFPENREVRQFFIVGRIRPGRTPTALAFFAQLKRTYEILCSLLESRNLQERPNWDGETVRYRQRSRRWKRQKKATQKKEVVAPILDELQRQGWPESIDAPEAVMDADVSQQLARFSQTAPIKLRYVAGRIFWEPASFPRQRVRRRGGKRPATPGRRKRRSASSGRGKPSPQVKGKGVTTNRVKKKSRTSD